MIDKIFIESVPIVGQVYGLTKVAMKVHNVTSPIEALKSAIVEIVIDCSPPVC